MRRAGEPVKFIEIRVIMYSFYQSPEGELVLLLLPFEDEPGGNPLLFYDGSGTAFLFRSFESFQMLQDIPEKYIKILNGLKEIKVVEFADMEVAREYMATIERVDDVQQLFGRRD